MSKKLGLPPSSPRNGDDDGRRDVPQRESIEDRLRAIEHGQDRQD